MKKKVAIFFSKNKLCFNYDLWDQNGNNLLLITGLSGSGKTFFAKNLGHALQCDIISFDALRFYNEASIISKKYVDKFSETCRSVKKHIENNWNFKNGKFDLEEDKKFTEYCKLFYMFLLNFAREQQIKLIIEGIQFFTRIPFYLTNEAPKIVLLTSSLQSFIRKIKRDKNNARKLLKDFELFYMYHVKQRNILNKYISYFEVK